jgi:5-methylcytosine-specific restriction enzyme A
VQHNKAYDSGEWRRFRDGILRAWRREHGNLCPGFERPPHTDGILSVNHKVALADGGPMLPGEDGVDVMCTGCNALAGVRATQARRAPTPPFAKKVR